ncbi:hypothetical protein MNB_SM-4-1805 [hydrothermal vent metagenome]|uniref:DUF481 domain-containing protein n=1 Tax=hydrothermal vent metagenome TaxID=652676 RepID=A0A1W1CAE8_9ZZZZ
MKKIVLSTLLISTLVLCAEPDTTKDDPFLTHTELGFIQTEGNTKTTTYTLDTKAKKGWGKHLGNFMFDGQYASDQNVETKNKFVSELTYNYEFTDRFAFDYLLGYKADKFSGFDYQWYTGPGAKYKLIVSENHNLTVDGNLLYSEDRYEATPLTTPPLDSYSNTYLGYRLKAVYAWQIIQNLKFDQELSIRGSFEETKNYFAFSKSALSSKISDIFSASISYKVDYANVPASGKKSTDTTLTANLIIDY